MVLDAWFPFGCFVGAFEIVMRSGRALGGGGLLMLMFSLVVAGSVPIFVARGRGLVPVSFRLVCVSGRFPSRCTIVRFGARLLVGFVGEVPMCGVLRSRVAFPASLPSVASLQLTLFNQSFSNTLGLGVD